jgi:hypothetical protein
MSFIQLFHSLPQVGAAAPFLASTLLASLALLPEMAHGDDRGSDIDVSLIVGICRM